MKLSNLSLLAITLSSIATGCKREKSDLFEESDTIPIGTVIGVDEDRAAFYADSVRRANDPAYRDSMEKVEAAQRKERETDGQSSCTSGISEDRQEKNDKEAKERQQRRDKTWRDFDPGVYGEHTHGFDRDNYDPDIDDW